MASVVWALTLLAALAAGAPADTGLPIVDLGYTTGGYYNFSNIRYAQPPIGNLRFAAPVPPKGKSSVINNGSVGAICPQALPVWTAISAIFVPKYLTGQPFDLAATEAALANSSSSPPAIDPRTSEDCLFLDVIVPQTVFKKQPVPQIAGAANPNALAPVMVWIYGGGYTLGEKSLPAYNPTGLIKASQVNGSEGAFGWLGGPTLQSNGVANAALYDQRLALQWVQDNIHLFGGDKTRVTVFGESAGGGSIMHQITAFGGLAGPAPFAQAVLQSPAFQNRPGSLQQEETLQTFLSLLNVTSIEEARQLPSEALIKANAQQVGASTYGQFSYGPVVDGLFAPALPGRLLLQGSFDKNVKVMVGHNANEGLIFIDPAIMNSTDFAEYLAISFPDASAGTLNYIETVLYPPVFDGSFGYTSEIQRANLVLSESTFTCTTNYLNRAFRNNTFAYQFSVGPALHGQDVPYTFFNGPNPEVLNPQIALALQDYITSFVQTGIPSGVGLPKFPMFGGASLNINFNTTGISVITDPTSNPRCRWWQKA
ncbi:MAG: hypothetical protein Q9187_005294, partial [Circinaria calcarea]